MSTTVSNVPCYENLLADQAALASQIYNPVPPYPVLYSSPECGGALTGANFPLFYFPVDCTVDLNKLDTEGVPPPEKNCLRVLDAIGDTFDPLSSSVTLTPLEVNVLPGGFQKDGVTSANNIFVDGNARLYSFYCPPQFKMYFYVGNPMRMTLSAAAAMGYVEIGPGELYSDACLNPIALSNGDTFFDYKGTSQPNIPSCRLANCHCGVDATGGQPYCDSNTSKVDCPGVEHHAPYMVLVRIEEYSNMIEDMCVKNRQIALGTDLNSLNRVWSPQTNGCDNYITNLCQSSDLSQTVYKDTCSCYTQQKALNQKYGAALDVPVCCFGEDPSGQITKACAFNTAAYKTGPMLKNCCSFAECQQVVSQSEAMREKATPPGEIKCDGNLVKFPVPSTSSAGPIPSAIETNKSVIPLYSWIVLGVAITLLLVFIILLLFLKPGLLRLPRTKPVAAVT